jgi:hypothetical protein
MDHLTAKFAALCQLPTQAAAIADDEALAYYLSDWVLGLLPAWAQRTGQGYDPPRRQPGFELFLPFAVASDFPRCMPVQIRQVALYCTYGILYNGLLDALFDIPDRAGDETLSLAQYTLLRMHTGLHQLFPADSPFWAYLEVTLTRFLQAMQEEKQRHKRVSSAYSYLEFLHLAQGKMAIALTPSIALAILDGTPERIPLLCQSWDELSVGVVTFDDIKDWQDDLLESNYTFLLCQVLSAQDTSPGAPPPSVDEVAYRIARSGVLEMLYEVGARHLERAAELAQAASAPALAQLAITRSEAFLKYRRQLVEKRAAVFVEHLLSTGG